VPTLFPASCHRVFSLGTLRPSSSSGHALPTLREKTLAAVSMSLSKQKWLKKRMDSAVTLLQKFAMREPMRCGCAPAEK
jgi:hypothetical protein